MNVGKMSRMSDMDIMSLHNKITGTVHDPDQEFGVDDLQTSYTCENCGENDLFHNSSTGTTSCANCGIDMNAIDYTQEWRNDADGEDQTRCGKAIDKHMIQYSLSTGIQMGMGARNTKLYKDIQRAVIWNSIPTGERALKERFENIETKCSLNDIDNATIEQVKDLYYEINEKMENLKIKRKRSFNNEGIQAAALLYVYKMRGKPRTVKEVSKIFGIESKYASAGVKIFSTLMGDTYNVNISKYDDFIDRFCDKLNLQRHVKTRVEEIANKANKLGILESNAPISVVAGCIYFVLTEAAISSINKSQVAKVCGVSSQTVDQVCKKLFDNTLKLMLP